MTGNTHALIGFTTGLWIAYLSHAAPPEALVAATAAGLAALLPDIDHHNSKISHKARPARLIFRWFKHRGLTHSLLAAVAVYMLATALLPLPYGLAFGVGYWSHILADMATVGGVRLLYPLPRYWTLPLTITTGGELEMLVRFCAGVVLLAGLLTFAPDGSLQWLADNIPPNIP